MKISCDLNEIDKMTYELHKKIFAQITKGIDLPVTTSQLYMLLFIRKQGECMMTDIANYLGVTLGAVTSIVDKLYDFGLVIRDRSLTDRRQVIIKLSEGGQELLRKVDIRRKQVFDYCFKDMDQEEIKHLGSVVDKIVDRLLSS